MLNLLKMNEFKGTKGNWRCVIPEGYGKSTLVMNGTDIICEMVKFEGKRYNAKLISKSPEMLNMLKELYNKIDFEFPDGDDLELRLEKLIKEATTI